ncbi:hypothetical protein LguiA_004379 [Lonicera macranthoides]
MSLIPSSVALLASIVLDKHITLHREQCIHYFARRAGGISVQIHPNQALAVPELWRYAAGD